MIFIYYIIIFFIFMKIIEFFKIKKNVYSININLVYKLNGILYEL